ncbi:hypothetical protein DOY81_007695, partial [Sarcophaga bullata]
VVDKHCNYTSLHAESNAQNGSGALSINGTAQQQSPNIKVQHGQSENVSLGIDGWLEIIEQKVAAPCSVLHSLRSSDSPIAKNYDELCTILNSRYTPPTIIFRVVVSSESTSSIYCLDIVFDAIPMKIA